MGAIIAVIGEIISLVPVLVAAEKDVAPLITKARAALNHIGENVAPDDEEFKKLDAEVSALEGQFQDAVAAHLKAVGAS